MKKPIHKYTPERSRVWMYQLPNDKPRRIAKRGKWWYYSVEGNKIGSDSLVEAKNDLEYMEAKVWSILK